MQKPPVLAGYAKMINLASISVSTTLAVGATIPGTEQTVHIAGNCDNAADKGLEIVSCYYGYGTEIPGLSGSMNPALPVLVLR
jgi:hypothetical protein